MVIINNYLVLDIFYMLMIYSRDALHKEDKCYENGKIYNIGEKYTKLNFDCQICICEGIDNEKCKVHLRCNQLNCQKNYSHEILCCKKLNCPSIYFDKSNY